MVKYNIYKLNNYDSINCTRFLEANGCYEFVDFKRKKCYNYFSNYASMNHDEYDLVIMNKNTNGKINEYFENYGIKYSLSFACTSKNINDDK